MSEAINSKETREPLRLTFEHDEDPEGWCSFCKGPASRAVSLWIEDAIGGIPQAEASFDEDKKSLGRNAYYRVGACCIGRMVMSLEEKK